MSDTLCYVCQDSGHKACTSQGSCIKTWAIKRQQLAHERERQAAQGDIETATRPTTTLARVQIGEPSGRPIKQGSLIIHERIQSGIARAGTKLSMYNKAIINVRHVWVTRDTRDRNMREAIQRFNNRIAKPATKRKR